MDILTFKFIITAFLLSTGKGAAQSRQFSVDLTKFTCEITDKNFFELKICNLTKSAMGYMTLGVHLLPLQKLENIKVIRKCRNH